MKKIVILIAMISAFIIPQSTYANTNPVEALPYKVILELPDNQQKGIKGYYNLSLSEGEEQTLNMTLQNISDNTIHLTMRPGNALTSTQGGIIYIENRGNEYTTLTEENFYMDQNITVPEKVELAPHEEKVVSVKVKALEKGTSLGSVLISQDEADFETIKENENVELSAKNRFMFAVPIQINTEEKPNSSENIKLLDIKNIIAPNKSFIGLELENPNAEIKEISFKYKVFNKKGEVLFDGEATPFNAAPKSKVLFHIPWQAGNYEAGKYQIKLTSDQIGEEVTKEFSIKRDDVKSFITESGLEVPNPILNMPLLFWIVIAVIIVGSVYVSYRIGRKKSEKDVA